MKKTIFAAALAVLALNFYAARAQNPAIPAAPLETVLTEAQKQTDNYRETFRNLLADETKIFEDFDKNGASDSRTTVRSNFLVYQSGKNASVTTEMRNVTEVNGKPVGDSQKRAGEFLSELEKEKTLEKELQRIQKESSRYDKTWEVYGLTLNQAVALAPNLRPFFDFKMLGTESYQGTEVYVVSYQQTKKSPYNTLNGKDSNGAELTLNFRLDVPGELKKNDNFLRGKLWIDAKTYQIWREERELTIQSGEPLVLLSNVFEYQASDYGILVPKIIALTVFNIKKEKGGDRFVSVKDASINFEYSKFRQTNVEVRILDDETE
jgi:hypothetical protein